MTHSKYFILGILVLLFIVSAYRFVQYRVHENYYLYGLAQCNPETESCFVAECFDAECDEVPYKKYSALASNAPDCLLENSCENFTCEGMHECEIILCDDTNLEDGEICIQTKI